MKEEAAIWIFLLVLIILFAGEPDIHGAIVNHLNNN